MLLTLAGWTGPRIAEAFGVRDDTVRLWRSDFIRDGAEAPKATVALGPAGVKSDAALRVVMPLLEAPVAARPNYHSPPAHRDRSAGGRAHQPFATVEGVAQKKSRWRRPRHALKGRQTAAEVEPIGLRLQLRKQQAEAAYIVLLYGDESEALTHPYLARAWAKTGAELRVPAPGQAKKVALLGSLDHANREVIVHTSPIKRTSDFVAHLEQLDRHYGPRPGQPFTPVVLVEDNSPIHTSKLALAALATRAHWFTVEYLPKYAAELNDIEPVWRDLKAHHLAHQTFADANELDQAIHQAVGALNDERMAPPLTKARIFA